MRENEAAAHQLASSLRVSGIACRVQGGGVHWQVELDPTSGRSLRVHCFWYEKTMHALVLGMNPANRRSALRGKQTPREGAEFYVVLEADGERVADGRTSHVEQVVACARGWLSGGVLTELYSSVPFIDAQRRAMEEFGARLDPRIGWAVGDDPSFELWAHQNGRSCRVFGEACSFLIGQVQVAYREGLDDLPHLIASWLVEGAGLAELRAQGAQIERHAEALSNDPAKWHWLHVRDRAADPEDSLAGLEPLLRRLAESPIASRFYTFSSLSRLCFSASSHYPWVGTYPVVASAGGGRYLVDRELHSLHDTVALVEAALAASPFEPFFGSATELALKLATENLKCRGSRTRAELVRRGQWGDVWLRSPSGRCQVTLGFLTLFDGGRELTLGCATFEDVIDLALLHLEAGVSPQEVAADKRVVPQSE